MIYDRSRRSSLLLQRRAEHWKFWAFFVIGVAVTICVVVFTILK
jgi:hypothetical protein